jgi:branched-chain amino acid transport system ATP-binding protein
MTGLSLTVNDVMAGYTAVPVLRGVTLSIGPGEVVALVGPNGAGKTTLLRTITGQLPVSAGTIHLDSSDITSATVPDRVRAGIALVPEGRRLFAQMSVEDNLLMGAFLTRDKAEVARRLAEVYALLPVLAARRTTFARFLSGGEQQMCAIGRALMGNPRLLLVDELSLGLAPQMVGTLAERLTTVAANGTSILLVDQDVDIALEIAHRGYLLEGGEVRIEGSAEMVWGSRTIRDWYLGEAGPAPDPHRERDNGGEHNP